MGEFRVPTGTHVHTDPEKKEQLKFEERTATGIVVKRNLDSHGTLQVYLLETGRIVNRAKLLQERTHTSELKKQLERLTPTREVAEEDLLRICPKLSSRKRRRDPRDETRRGERNVPEQIDESIDTNARGDENTPTDEINDDDDELPPVNTIPVRGESLPDIDNTDTSDKTMDQSSVDAMDTEQDNSETRIHDEHQNDNDTRLPADVTTEENSEENNITQDTAETEENLDEIRDTPKLPRKIRRLQKKLNDKRMKEEKKSKPFMPETPPTGLRYPKRSNRNNLPSKYVHASAATDNMSIKQARERFPKLYREAMRKELQQMHNKKVIEAIDVPISGLKHSKVIGVKGLFKEKLNISTGQFEKLKFRLVPQGHQVDRSLYSFDETTSPTVSLESVFATINLAAYENRRGFTMAIKQARERFPKLYREAMRKELQQMHNKKVIEAIDVPISGLKHSKVIGVKGFFKEKLNISTGQFEKLKFRLVPQGHQVDRSLYSFDETTSPTVSLESVFATINLAAYENRRGFTMDIPGAYLNAELKEPHMVRFGVDLAAEYINLYPKYKRHLQDDGTMLFVVKKAFYGLPESSALWYDDISKFLLEKGYKSHPCDKGLFVYSDPKDPKKSCTLCLWVDDILGWATHDSLIRELEESVIKKYDDARLNVDGELQYFGMVITQPTNGVIYVSQHEYTKKIIEATGITGEADNPNHSNLLKNKTKEESKTGVSSAQFASYLMMAMYLAKRTRPDILTPLSILATRMQNPDKEDMIALEKVFKYLNKTKNFRLTYNPKSMELHYWSDAAYAVHRDKRRGHTGIMATLGFANAPIFAKSGKQKIHTRSSTEAELVALDECVLHMLWMRQILDFLGFPQQPSYAYQDNKSTIVVCETGHSKHGKLKHMAVRYYFIHGQIEQNILKIKYCKTSDMTADLLTKPLSGESFNKLRDNILNVHRGI